MPRLKENGIRDAIEDEDHVEIHGPFSVGANLFK